MNKKYSPETITSRDAGVSPMNGFTRVSGEYFLFMSRCQCFIHIYWHITTGAKLTGMNQG
jgi:hypothetical protein